MSGDIEWQWGKSMGEAFDRMNVVWSLTPSIEGEPEDAPRVKTHFNGARLLIHEGCDEDWLAHMLAHMLISNNWVPNSSKDRFWGLHRLDKEEVDAREEEAETLSVAILLWLKLPWRSMAREMMLVESSSPTSDDWKMVKEDVLERSADFKTEFLGRLR